VNVILHPGFRRAAVVAAVALATSCAHSVLIARDDTTYRRALERYRRMRQLVTQTLAPDSEQDEFMMAEGLFRYRFAAPQRNPVSYVAEIGASLVDIPALEALAGSLDLFSLRLKTNDGAVQLWETLLANDPTTPLAPLALYRLGWAYRKTVVSGLPRDSDRAFDALIKQHPESELVPLAVAAKQVLWKSPGKATAWSLVPGLGQIYVGEYGSGVARFAIAMAAAAAILVPAAIAYERRDDLSWNHDWPLLVSGVVGGMVLTIDYERSYEDALRGVIELDERREAEFEDVHWEAP
jgi:hypothetical protein